MVSFHSKTLYIIPKSRIATAFALFFAAIVHLLLLSSTVPYSTTYTTTNTSTSTEDKMQFDGFNNAEKTKGSKNKAKNCVS